MKNLNEDTLSEQPVIGWLKEMGYEYRPGPEIAPGSIFMARDSFREVLLTNQLKNTIRRLNPSLSDKSINEAVRIFSTYHHPDLEFANREIYSMIIGGIKIEVRDEKGEERGLRVKLIDFDNPQNNDFLVVNQFAVHGAEKLRRPDIVIFINGIPVVLFELKSPTNEGGTIFSAYKQILEYKKDIPDIFKYNQIIVVSDLIKAKQGTISSSWEWFSTWKRIDDKDTKDIVGLSELEIHIKGVFQKERLLDLIHNFIVFEADSEKDVSKYTKKISQYHQYYGVNKAIKETLRSTSKKGNKKIGVFWHTQGSGKSLSMVFYVNKTKGLKELASPTFLFLTDRNDLDGQLYKTFLRTGYQTLAKQAETVDDLKKKLQTAGAEILFTTIQKFENDIHELNNRENIIVIADEAHRSQYAQFAAHVRHALPNASFMGITGTPISLNNRNTRLVFGDHIDEYTIDQSVKDGATVPIYYEGRLIPLHVMNEFIDEEFEDLVAEHTIEIKESLKRKLAKLEDAVGAPERLEKISQDIVSHFNNRGLEGKGMIVTMSRKIAVEMYQKIHSIPNAPEIAVVISNAEEYKGKIQNELDNKELEKRFKNIQDSLKMVIVCDMWLTGFDVPSLHTMYIDKPLKNHTLMQAIARVNRIFKDKPGGLIVDYVGIADNLKKALSIYSSGIQSEAMIPLIVIIQEMHKRYETIKSMLTDISYQNWKKLESTELAQLFHQALNLLITDNKNGRYNEAKRDEFLRTSRDLLKLFSLAMPHAEAVKIQDDVLFFQALKKALYKTIILATEIFELEDDKETAIRDLVSKAIGVENIIDIFGQRNKEKPNISILDEAFLEDVKKTKFKNLTVETLRKILNDELNLRFKQNMIRFQSLHQRLEEIIEQYENNIINSSKVIERLIELAKEINKTEDEGKNLGLTQDEVAFYDVIAHGKKSFSKDESLKKFVKELVKTIRQDLTIDWTNKENIKARIRANVRLMLLKKGFQLQESEQILDLVYNQAVMLYQDFIPS